MLARLVVSLTLVATLFAASSAQASFGDPVPSYGAKGRAVLRLGVTSRATAVIAQSGGRVVIAGSVGDTDSYKVPEGFVARLTAAGELDPSFGVNGIVKFSRGFSVKLAGANDGTIYALSTGGGADKWPREIVALSPDGQPIPWFGVQGKIELGSVLPGFAADDIAVQANSLLVAGTKPTDSYRVGDTVLARLTTTGKLDPSFGNAGAVHGTSGNPIGGTSVAVLPDQSIVTTINGLVKYDASGALVPNFHSIGPSEGWDGYGDFLELAATPSGGFAAISTITYYGKGSFTKQKVWRFEGNGSLISVTEPPLQGVAPVTLADGTIVAVGDRALGTANADQYGKMQASLIPAGGGAAMTIDQAAGERSVAASAAELPNRELALVGQSCDGICNAIVLKLRLVESKAKKLSPGLWKPHKQINSGRPIKRFSGIASPAKGIKSVDVAIHLANVQPIRSAPCRWLGKDRVHFVKREMTPTGPCGKPILIRATGGKHWHLDLPRALPAGIYEVFVRGRWSGNRYNELAQEPGSYLFFATSWPPKK